MASCERSTRPAASCSSCGPGSHQGIHLWLRQPLSKILQSFASKLHMMRPLPVHWPGRIWASCDEPPLEAKDALSICEGTSGYSLFARQFVASIAMLAADRAQTSLTAGWNDRRQLERAPRNCSSLLGPTSTSNRPSRQRSRRRCWRGIFCLVTHARPAAAEPVCCFVACPHFFSSFFWGPWDLEQASLPWPPAMLAASPQLLASKMLEWALPGPPLWTLQNHRWGQQALSETAPSH